MGGVSTTARAVIYRSSMAVAVATVFGIYLFTTVDVVAAALGLVGISVFFSRRDGPYRPVAGRVSFWQEPTHALSSPGRTNSIPGGSNGSLSPVSSPASSRARSAKLGMPAATRHGEAVRAIPGEPLAFQRLGFPLRETGAHELGGVGADGGHNALGRRQLPALAPSLPRRH